MKNKWLSLLCLTEMKTKDPSLSLIIEAFKKFLVWGHSYLWSEILEWNKAMSF